MALILAGSVAYCFFADDFSETRPRGALVIALPEGAGGMVPRAIIKDSDLKLQESQLDVMSFKDCCSSNMSWALSGQEISMAVLCPEAARQLLSKDKRYVKVGPVAANSDVLVVRPGIIPKSIGVMHNRPDQTLIVEAYYGEKCRTVPMLPGALPYAYERKAVDGVVADAFQALNLPGEKLPGSIRGDPLISYVLVARKDLIGTPDYEAVMRKWSELVQTYSETGLSEDLMMQEITDHKIRDKEVKKWIQTNVILLDPMNKS